MNDDATERLRGLGERVEHAVFEAVGRAASRMQERKPLSADLLESDDAFLAVFDAAGATAGDVDVRFDDSTVFVRIDRFREFYDEFEMRVPGRGLSLSSSVSLPGGDRVDPREATATVTDNGVLHVRIPKTGDSTDVTVSDAESDRHGTAVEIDDGEPAAGADGDDAGERDGSDER
jgi:HSP20 family molecular chaperone IbpA